MLGKIVNGTEDIMHSLRSVGGLSGAKKGAHSLLWVDVVESGRSA